MVDTEDLFAEQQWLVRLARWLPLVGDAGLKGSAFQTGKRMNGLLF
ncbi:hypothetical protein [Desulfogranum mediterraneum]|nr:hypothetical protein [Desulfogranum mediterraneum]